MQLIRVHVTNCVENWKIGGISKSHFGLKHLCTYVLKWWKFLFCIKSLFRLSCGSITFLPSFIPEGNRVPDLHDSESRSSFTRITSNWIRIAANIFNSIPHGFSRNGMSSNRIHVNNPLNSVFSLRHSYVTKFWCPPCWRSKTTCCNIIYYYTSILFSFFSRYAAILLSF